MQITDDLFDKLARLSKLKFSDEERVEIMNDFQHMLEFVDQLQEVDTEGVEPLIHMTEEVNHFRADAPSLEISQEESLRNAPEKNDSYFLVPKVVRK